MKNNKLENVRLFIRENSKCELISDTYNGFEDKLLFKCECGNEFITTYNKFKFRNKRCCNECSGLIHWDMLKAKKYITENSDCILLDDIFIRANEKMTFKCKCGEEFITTLDKFIH